jgi:hypothetical protein
MEVRRKVEIGKAESRKPFQLFPMARLIIVVRIAINSDDSCSLLLRVPWVLYKETSHSRNIPLCAIPKFLWQTAVHFCFLVFPMTDFCFLLA